MFGKKKKKTTLDVTQIVGAAMTAFMEPDGQSERAPSKNHRESNGSNGGLGPVGAVAIGAALAVAARTAYSRARQLDLTRVADAVEQRLSD
jgi:hypothetical protein